MITHEMLHAALLREPDDETLALALEDVLQDQGSEPDRARRFVEETIRGSNRYRAVAQVLASADKESLHWRRMIRQAAGCKIGNQTPIFLTLTRFAPRVTGNPGHHVCRFSGVMVPSPRLYRRNGGQTQWVASTLRIEVGWIWVEQLICRSAT